MDPVDNNKIKHMVIALLVSTTIVAIVAGIIYACMDNNTKYYIAEQNCVTSGGSWIPQYNNSPMCIRGR